jgi:photosystem II stability/assembly factor-like uncharacterized protein
MRLYIAAGDALAVAWPEDGAAGGAAGGVAGPWRVDLQLTGRPAQCVAADPLHPERVYCGTFGAGLWRSDDAGATWRPAGVNGGTDGGTDGGTNGGGGIPYAEVMSVAVSRLERSGGEAVVWVGTEPSALFRSEDGGETWGECDALRRLPSAPTWSFPPRPWTSHVRWIAPDPTAPERVFAGIEAGGVLRSLDGGRTWEDSKPGAQRDAHTLGTHPLAPGRVYEASGGGYAQSDDGGASWTRQDDGLAWHYLWGLAADPADPETVVVSASRGARQAHDAGAAEAKLYRRTAGSPWREVREGLPEPSGTNAYVLAAHDAEPGVLYAAPHQGGIYRSADAGLTWAPLDLAWPAGYRPKDVRGLVAAAV